MVITTTESGPTIEQQDIDEPQRTAGQVLIEVHAASVNRADLAVLAGTHGTSRTGAGATVVGLDAAGTVIDADPGAELKVGQRVMTMVNGGLAERVVVDERMPIPLPDSWSFEDGAAAVLALMTEHNAIRTAGRFVPGNSVMVNAANSGVGQMGIRIAKHLGAGRIIAGVRSHKDDALLKELGADVVLRTDSRFFVRNVLDVTQGQGADIVVDHVGGPCLADNLRIAALRGRIISVGRLGGPQGPLDLEAVALRRLEIIGVTFRTRDQEEKALLVHEMRKELDSGISSGALKARIDRVLPWTDVHAAQAVVSTNGHLGKVVLKIGGQ
ncbi:zinc-binding dehydrogenase [Streptomyces viridiviolaceus]|uniref:Zinc-binding dehydrogenase n=1 Tax=Streptomyces viridiviolaceus TaxID=68282 RepID=A0ABW2EAN0_9ACTN|nr:zinc-binding dehydrogenase [Streptomyces viridiviolaceus]